MVALLRSPAPAAPASVIQAVPRRVERTEVARVEDRASARHRVALQAWLCAEDASYRGYVLELSLGGARVGGVGTRLQPGERVLCKVVLSAGEAPVVLRAEVVRYALVVAGDHFACPELCVRFLDEGAEHERVEDYLRALTRRSHKRR